jgi:hypothetical protein
VLLHGPTRQCIHCGSRGACLEVRDDEDLKLVVAAFPEKGTP